MRGMVKTIAALALGALAETAVQAGMSIVAPVSASPLEQLAAREVRRYIYLRTGQLLPVVQDAAAPVAGNIVIARQDRPLSAPAAQPRLGPEQYRLKSSGTGQARTLYITGGDDTGTLYAAYRFVEHLGVRFYLHGDVIPDERTGLALPELDETARPLFELRGLTPFHDFPEGPDWWEQDDYLLHLSQMAKMRMNFIGFHCYPERGRGPEPSVWIGLPGDFDAQGRVSYCYPVQWASTARDRMWGFAAMDTYDFCAGASRLFPADVFGPSVMAGAMPSPTTFDQGNRVFNNTASLFRAAFSHARALGIKTCLGTETPITVPMMVRQKLSRQGRDLRDPAVLQSVYEAVFRRIAASHPLDYYWLWTPEPWTWGGHDPGEMAECEQDIRAALAALKAVGQPFTLATCGWVLGPHGDRAALDRLLPTNSPMGCINREVGHSVVEPAFANLGPRPKWAIPWLENDWALTLPQLWAGRARYDAADARRLGCTGLFGIHWRTKNMAPNIAALAGAAWDQSWVAPPFDPTPVRPSRTPADAPSSMMIGFPTPVSGADDPAPYGSMRAMADGYLLEPPNGQYTVTLKFQEAEFTKAGARIFDVSIQGRPVVTNLDIFARAGANAALALPFPGVQVTNEQLRIDFKRIRGTNIICAIDVEGLAGGTNPYAMKLNCGGLRHRDYDQDLFTERLPDWNRRRGMPVGEFYADFARANFGPAAAEAAGRILTRIDGANLPQPASWNAGPGAINPDPAPWALIKARYAFVDEWERLREQVRGAGNVERFDYWLNSFRALAAAAQAGCVRGELDRVMGAVMAERDEARRKTLARQGLEIRVRLARAWERLMWFTMAATDTPGELGMIADLEQHNRKYLGFISLYDPELAVTLGEALPAAIQPSGVYQGPVRLIVPTARNQAAPGETLSMRVLWLDAKAPQSLEVCWRPLGGGEFKKTPLKNLGRAVYTVDLPPAEGDFEFYFAGESAAGQKLVWPATAPGLNQSVVVCAPAGK